MRTLPKTSLAIALALVFVPLFFLIGVLASADIKQKEIRVGEILLIPTGDKIAIARVVRVMTAEQYEREINPQPQLPTNGL